MENEKLNTPSKVELVLSNVYNLPPIPQVMTDVINLLAKPNTSVTELSSVISKDQGLITKILTIANSPLYGLSRKVSSIDFAIFLLGFSEIQNIVSTLTLIETFRNKSDKYMDQSEFWKHSFITGAAAKRLCADLGVQGGSEAFIAGFLHDLGVSIIHRYFHSKFPSIVEKITNEKLTPSQAEIEILGVSHQEIGHFLSEKWNFPDNLSDIVLYHHDPMNAQINKKLCLIIHFADYMTNKMGIGDFRWDRDIELNEAVYEEFNFKDEVEVENFMMEYKKFLSDQFEMIRFLN